MKNNLFKKYHYPFIDQALIKNDFYSTKYFLDAINILNHSQVNHHTSVMQFKCFHHEPYMIAGVYECIEILKTRLSPEIFTNLEIYYYPDGTIINPNQCALSIRARYQDIAMLENILDSILARRSSVATNCYYFLKYLKPEQIIYMADRSDDYHLMPYDGYSAYVAGIRNFSNDAHVYFLDKETTKVFGSIPHALIQQFDGDIIKTFKQYHQLYANDISMLIDYHNDIISDLSKLQPYFNEIQSIRVDTSNNMIDACLEAQHANDKAYYGANANLFFEIRKWLDTHDAKHIKIICSSNNTLEKIKLFKELNVPVDYYGIGSSLNKLSLHFTADVVMNDEHLEAKNGRNYIDVTGMEKYQHEKSRSKY